LDFQEAHIKASIIDSQAGAHGAASFMLPEGIPELKNIIFHYLGE
jgi:hypothetical protein